MKRFWLDASSLIWCDRDLFRLNKVPKYWEWLEDRFEDGSVVTHRKIWQEVVKGTTGDKPSPLALWVKSRKGKWCSYTCTDESKAKMGEVSLYCIKKYGYEVADGFLHGGDAQLMCRAFVDGGIVVTQESVQHDPRIPSVCDYFGIKHTPMNKMNILLDMDLS